MRSSSREIHLIIVLSSLAAAGCVNSSVVRDGYVTSPRVFALTQISAVNNLTLGSDGRMWFTLPLAKAIGAVDSRGNVEMYQNPENIDAEAERIAAGPDGALWFTQVNSHAPVDSGPDMIGRITTKGIWSEYPIASWDALPTGIAAGPDGAMWFAERHANAIGRITKAGKIVEYPLPHVGGGPTEIVLGRDRKLWFTETDGDRIGCIDPATDQITDYAMPMPKSKPGPIAVDLAGEDVGVVELASHRLVLFDTVKHVFKDTSARAPVALTTGTNSAIWFIDSNGDVGFQPGWSDRHPNLINVVTQDSLPTAIALGPSGELWFAVRKGPTYAYAGTGAVGYLERERNK